MQNHNANMIRITVQRPGRASLEHVEPERVEAYIQAVEAEEGARVLVVGGRIYADRRAK